MPTLLKISLTLFITIFFHAANSKEQYSCYAEHLDTEEEVEVKIISAITSKKIATAQWPLGYPTIAINDSDFIKLPENARQFIYYHECAHLKYQIKDEFQTDCKSLELINEKHSLTELDIKKLVDTLVKEFGMSLRWNNLLECNVI